GRLDPAKPRGVDSEIEVEVRTPLKVLPCDDQKMGELIDKLGRTMLDRSSRLTEEAQRSLAAIADERVIPFFNELAKSSYSGDRFAACRVLARFKSDDALWGIKKAMATQAADVREHTNTDELARESAASVRHAAAWALADSHHPDAKPLLMSMWEDPSDAVRITVLPALAQMDSPDALGSPHKLSSDSDEDVRTGAGLQLQQKRQKETEKQ